MVLCPGYFQDRLASTLKPDLNLYGLHRRHHIWPQIEPTRTLVRVYSSAAHLQASDTHYWQ